MSGHKFNPDKLEKLNQPDRLQLIDFHQIMPQITMPVDGLMIDIGVGTGIFAERLLKLFPKAKCIGLDIAPVMLHWMEEHRIPQFNGRLEVMFMQENQIPLKDHQADLAVMITVHHEMDNSQKQLQDVHRVLKETGQILVCDWKEGAHHHFVKKQQIIDDLRIAGFSEIQEIEASERLVCLLAKA